MLEILNRWHTPISNLDLLSGNPWRERERERSSVRAVFNFAVIMLEKASEVKRKLRITRKSTHAQRNLMLSESIREADARLKVPHSSLRSYPMRDRTGNQLHSIITLNVIKPINVTSSHVAFNALVCVIDQPLSSYYQKDSCANRVSKQFLFSS